MDRETRIKAVLHEYDKGTDTHSIAEMFGIQHQTVMTYIREHKAVSKQEEIEGASAHKMTIRNWVKGLTVLDTLKTPRGKMMVAEIHPHVIRCFNSGGFETFEAAQLYYMNRRSINER